MPDYKITAPDGSNYIVTAPDGADENSILGFAHTVLSGVKDAINRGMIGGLVGTPVDLVNTALTPIGLGSDKPVMGSEWIGDKMHQAGMVSGNRNPIAEGLAGFVDPATIGAGAIKIAAGIPAIAGMVKGAGKAEDALKATKTEFEIAHEMAQRNAALPVEQGGLGLPPNNTDIGKIHPMSEDYSSLNIAKEAGFDLPKDHRLWFRFGDIPEGGISRHVQHGFEEGGTSVLFPAPVLGKSDNYWTPQLLMSMTAGEMGSRPLKIISGKQKIHNPYDINQRGYGSDGEPLLEANSVKSVRDATPLERYLLVKDMNDYAVSQGFSPMDGKGGRPNIFKLLNAEKPDD